MKIEIEGLSMCFNSAAGSPDKTDVLKSLDYSGDIHSLAIIGPSGGGKSTLLRIIGGLITPTAGRMWIDGDEISFDSAGLWQYRKNIGFVFQQGGLFRHMSGFDNITVPLIKVHGYSKEQAEHRANELLSRFGLSGDGHKMPYALSGGQQQRIAIARAIAENPKVLLLDEPTSALDPEYTVEVLNIINELKNDEIDFIIVTHEMGFARHACDDAAFLYDGALLESGASADIFTKPKTEQLKNFLGKLLEWNV